MFTGIIEEVGEITDVQHSADAARITVRGPLVTSDAHHGDSISVGGVCLTVVDQTTDSFTADVMAETLTMSTLGSATAGRWVNLERAAAVGDRIGGHIVQGHIDGTARILATTDGGAWRVVRLSLAPELAPLVVRKGSIAIDGISLTVSAVGGGTGGAMGGGTDRSGDGDAWFEVSLIPETLTATTLGDGAVGDSVNIETDILARHVERMLSLGFHTPSPTETTPAADLYYTGSEK
ncbi:MAG TPA: riboflavin synthase [Microbacteriaceae bacterium]